MNYIIIDGSYFLFYRYYAILNWFKHAKKDVELTNPIENEDFVKTFKKTFIDKIKGLSKKLKIDNPMIIVAKDCHRRDIWRMKSLTTYKGTRENDDTFLGGPFFKMAYKNKDYNGLFKEAGAKYILFHPKLEADDCAAITAKWILKRKPDSKVTIITSDTDYMQLIRPGIQLYNLHYRNVNTEKNSFGDPDKDLFYKIIGGDKSDNIPAIFKRGGKKKIMKCYDDREYFRTLLIKEYGNEELGFSAVKKNRQLIDFNEIPLYLKNEFLNSIISYDI
jgi:5'-3' exonuclease